MTMFDWYLFDFFSVFYFFVLTARYFDKISSYHKDNNYARKKVWKFAEEARISGALRMFIRREN